MHVTDIALSIKKKKKTKKMDETKVELMACRRRRLLVANFFQNLHSTENHKIQANSL